MKLEVVWHAMCPPLLIHCVVVKTWTVKPDAVILYLPTEVCRYFLEGHIIHRFDNASRYTLIALILIGLLYTVSRSPKDWIEPRPPIDRQAADRFPKALYVGLKNSPHVLKAFGSHSTTA